jgi:Zn-dependent peptidase ImmA (M78 family)
MIIPATIKIGNLVYKIEKIEDKFEESDFYGRSWTKVQKIKLNPNISKEHCEQTLFHEIIHIILDSGHYRDESSNEKIVSYLAQNLYQVLKDNKFLKD